MVFAHLIKVDKFEIPLTKRKREAETESADSPIDNNSKIINDIKSSENIECDINPGNKLSNSYSMLIKSQLELDKEIFSEYFETDDEEYDPCNPNDYEKVIHLNIYTH